MEENFFLPTPAFQEAWERKGVVAYDNGLAEIARAVEQSVKPASCQSHCMNEQELLRGSEKNSDKWEQERGRCTRQR